MKLYVINPSTKRRIYLKIDAHTRSELRRLIKKDVFTIRGKKYSINDVYAEDDSNSTTSGAVIGGLIGLLGGPIGVAVGAAAGGLLGNSINDGERKKVNSFNKRKNGK